MPAHVAGTGRGFDKTSAGAVAAVASAGNRSRIRDGSALQRSRRSRNLGAPKDPSRSLILGTMKVAAPAGAIVAFGMDGQIRQVISGIDRPNNIDVEYGVQLGAQRVDIAVATERLARQLRVFRIDPSDGRLVDLGGIPILEGQAGEAGAPMGIGLYRRARDGAIFAIVAPKEGPREGYLWQYRLVDAGDGRVGARFVRRFGNFSATTVREENEIEAVAVDDRAGVRLLRGRGGRHPQVAGGSGPRGRRAGARALRTKRLSRRSRRASRIYALPDGTGYIVATDQLDEDSEYHLYPREGTAGEPSRSLARDCRASRRRRRDRRDRDLVERAWTWAAARCARGDEQRVRGIFWCFAGRTWRPWSNRNCG